MTEGITFRAGPPPIARQNGSEDGGFGKAIAEYSFGMTYELGHPGSLKPEAPASSRREAVRTMYPARTLPQLSGDHQVAVGRPDVYVLCHARLSYVALLFTQGLPWGSALPAPRRAPAKMGSRAASILLA